MSGITIVVKSNDGQGRSQIAETIKQALEEKGFTDVHIVPCAKTDISSNGVPFKEQSITIVEA